MPSSRLKVEILLTSTLVLLRRAPSRARAAGQFGRSPCSASARRTPSLTRRNAQRRRSYGVIGIFSARFFTGPNRLISRCEQLRDDRGIPRSPGGSARVLLVMGGVIAAVAVALSTGAVKIPGLSGGSRNATGERPGGARRPADRRRQAVGVGHVHEHPRLEERDPARRDEPQPQLRPDGADQGRDRRDHSSGEPARQARAAAGRADRAGPSRAGSAALRDRDALRESKGPRAASPAGTSRRSARSSPSSRTTRSSARRSPASCATSCRSTSGCRWSRRARAGSSSASRSERSAARGAASDTFARWSATCSAARSRAAAATRSPASTATVAAAPAPVTSAATRSAPS